MTARESHRQTANRGRRAALCTATIAALVFTGCAPVVTGGTTPADTTDTTPDAAEEQAETTVLNTVDWTSPDGTLQSTLVAESETPGPREDDTGAFRTHCIESHSSFDDPLMAPGKPGAAHHHIFFGNPNVDAFTTAESLLQTATTTCDGVSLNKSGYWVPALFGASGERLTYVDPLFYYKTGYHLPADSITPPPAGLRMIAGNAMSTNPQNVAVTKFRCESWQAPEPQFSTGDPLDHVPYIPDCATGDIVEIRLVFPQCWDGQNLSAADHKSHMAYPSQATAPVTGTGTCPETHPVAIPEISYNFGIRVTDDTGPPSTWRFATDPDTADRGGYTLHGDWMNGWDTNTMNKIVNNCLRPANECMVGHLADGTQLRPVPLDTQQ